MRRSLLALVILAACGAGPAMASPWKVIGRTSASVQTDGARYVAWMAEPSTMLVRDEVTHTTRPVPMCPDAGIVSLRAGAASVVCDDRLMRVDLATGAAIASFRLPYLGPDSAIVDFGARWAEIEATGEHDDVTVWYDLVTGAHRGENAHADRVAPDLDAAGLDQPLCSPVRRPLNPDDDGLTSTSYWGRVERAGHWVAFIAPYAFDGDDVPLHTDVEAWRCGHPKPIRIAKCSGYCENLQAGGGYVTYESRQVPHVARLGGGPAKRVGLPASWSLLGHTRTGLYAIDLSGRIYMRRLQGVAGMGFPSRSNPVELLGSDDDGGSTRIAALPRTARS